MKRGLIGFVIGFMVIMLFHITPTFVGFVAGSLSFGNLFIDDTLTGVVTLNLSEETFLPAETEIIASLDGVSRSYALEEVLAGYIEKGEGEYYYPGYRLTGEGEGYGVLGKKVVSPNVTVSYTVVVCGIECVEIDYEAIVSNGEEYVQQIDGDNFTVELVDVSEENVSVELSIEESAVRVSTNYTVLEEGYGKGYITEDILLVQINTTIFELQIPDKESVFEMNLSYIDVLYSMRRNISARIENDEDNDWYADGEDCDDANPSINPGVAEKCNKIDDDCDGQIDEDFDKDKDGYFSNLCEGVYGELDCNDNEFAVNPSVSEWYYNGIDDDCSMETKDSDKDNDGSAYADDCDDENELMYPGNIEVLGDRLDNDCNNETPDMLLEVQERKVKTTVLSEPESEQKEEEAEEVQVEPSIKLYPLSSTLIELDKSVVLKLLAEPDNGFTAEQMSGKIFVAEAGVVDELPVEVAKHDRFGSYTVKGVFDTTGLYRIKWDVTIADDNAVIEEVIFVHDWNSGGDVGRLLEGVKAYVDRITAGIEYGRNTKQELVLLTYIEHIDKLVKLYDGGKATELQTIIEIEAAMKRLKTDLENVDVPTVQDLEEESSFSFMNLLIISQVILIGVLFGKRIWR